MLTPSRGRVEAECTRRTCQIEAQFRAECQTVTERCERALQSLELHLRRELGELREQQREERAQWQFEKDELAQECAEAREQLKEALRREAATALVLTQEREVLEKTYKEHLSGVVGEREQLLRDLEDLREASERQQSLLASQLRELQRAHQREREDRQQALRQAGAAEQLAGQQLERLQAEWDQERQDMMAKLLALEGVHRATCESADLDRAELSAEIARLQDKMKELQQVASPPSSQDAGGEEAEGSSGALSLLQQGEQLLEENGGVLLSLQRAHEQAVKDNVRMAAEISRLQQRLQKLEPGSVASSSCFEDGLLENPMEPAEPCLLQNRGKRAGGVPGQRIPSDLQGEEARDRGSTGMSSVRRQEEVRAEASEASLGSFSELENSDETRTETWDLKSQVSQLREQLTALRADCDRASERKRELLLDVSVLKKQLGVLERMAQASPQHGRPNEGDTGRDQDCLLEELRALEAHYEEALESNKELAAEVFRLQDKLRRAEEVAETFLSLEKGYDEVQRENEELQVVVLRLEGTIERLQEGAALQRGRSSPWEAPSEDLAPRPGPSGRKGLALHQTLETPSPKALNVCRVIEEHYRENQYLGQEDTQILGTVQAHEIAWLHRTVQTRGEKPGEQQSRVIIEENTTLLGLQHRHVPRQAVIAELELEKQRLQELTRKLRERVAYLVKQRDAPAPGGKEEELKAMMQDLQATCSEMQQKVELLR